MGLGSELEHADRFAAYVNEVTKVIGHADRAGPLRDYCLGLLMPGERKSVEPIAAVTAPGRVFGTASISAALRRQCDVVG